MCLVFFGLVRETSAQGNITSLPRGKKEKTSRVVPAPAAPAGMLPLLPRYWQMADSAERTDAAEVFNQYLRHFISYPTLALQAGVGGAIFARLTVQPDGRVSSISITRRDLSTSSPSIKVVLALDAELQRVAWQLRFKPALPRTDSTANASSISSADSLENIDITDVATATADSTDATDVTDVTDVAQPKNLADTVTIFHRFVPQKDGREASGKRHPTNAAPPKGEARALLFLLLTGRALLAAVL